MKMKLNTKTITIGAIVILAIALSAIPSSIFQVATAQHFRGDKIVLGNGLTGIITCPSGSPVSDSSAILQFNVKQSKKGEFGGQFYIFGTENFGIKNGEILNGHLTGKGFTLTGIEQQDTICDPNSFLISTTFMITGSCGVDAVTLTAANGETGTFAGSVACA
jgi:hypothetical protein